MKEERGKRTSAYSLTCVFILGLVVSNDVFRLSRFEYSNLAYLHLELQLGGKVARALLSVFLKILYVLCQTHSFQAKEHDLQLPFLLLSFNLLFATRPMDATNV